MSLDQRRFAILAQLSRDLDQKQDDVLTAPDEAKRLEAVASYTGLQALFRSFLEDQGQVH